MFLNLSHLQENADAEDRRGGGQQAGAAPEAVEEVAEAGEPREEGARHEDGQGEPGGHVAAQQAAAQARAAQAAEAVLREQHQRGKFSYNIQS